MGGQCCKATHFKLYQFLSSNSRYGWGSVLYVDNCCNAILLSSDTYHGWGKCCNATHFTCQFLTVAVIMYGETCCKGVLFSVNC